MQVLDAPDALRAAQQARVTIHHAFVSYQNAAERRRQLAAEIGELARAEMLATAGLAERDAREADVGSRHALAISAGT